MATGNGTANRRVGFGSPLPQVQDLTCPEGAATAQLRDCRAAVLTEPTACGTMAAVVCNNGGCGCLCVRVGACV